MLKVTKPWLFPLFPALLLLLGGCDVGINKSIAIEAGEKSRGVAVVNGEIDIGADAEVTGDVSTVNGAITVERGARVRGVNTVNGEITLAADATGVSIKCVNGDIDLGENVQLRDSIKLTNGRIDLASGVTVGDDIGIVAGSVHADGATVRGNVTTVIADVELAAASAIEGDLKVEKPDRVSGVEPEPPTIIIGPGSRVLGDLIFEAPAQVYVSEQAQIGALRGVLSEADIVRYASEAPPGR